MIRRIPEKAHNHPIWVAVADPSAYYACVLLQTDLIVGRNGIIALQSHYYK
jgi:hypothetical protein